MYLSRLCLCWFIFFSHSGSPFFLLCDNEYVGQRTRAISWRHASTFWSLPFSSSGSSKASFYSSHAFVPDKTMRGFTLTWQQLKGSSNLRDFFGYKLSLKQLFTISGKKRSAHHPKRRNVPGVKRTLPWTHFDASSVRALSRISPELKMRVSGCLWRSNGQVPNIDLPWIRLLIKVITDWIIMPLRLGWLQVSLLLPRRGITIIAPVTAGVVATAISVLRPHDQTRNLSRCPMEVLASKLPLVKHRHHRQCQYYRHMRLDLVQL